ITAAGIFVHRCILKTVSMNYMLMGVAFATTLSNMLDDDKLSMITTYYNPILSVSLIVTIVDLGAPLDWHLIMGAGVYTFVYIGSRAFGKYFGARLGATVTKMPEAVRKYLGLTLLPHSGVSLVFTGIICSTLSGGRPDLAGIVQGTIAAAAVINEIIAVIAARKGFQLAGEIGGELKITPDQSVTE
ncbi:MAG: transporter, partial [Anaerovoracaceae bacterium]